jgi:hypothetical protein
MDSRENDDWSQQQQNLLGPVAMRALDTVINHYAKEAAVQAGIAFDEVGPVSDRMFAADPARFRVCGQFNARRAIVHGRNPSFGRRQRRVWMSEVNHIERGL